MKPSYIEPFLFMKHSWTNSCNLSFTCVCVKGRSVKCVNAIAGGEGP